MTMHHPLEITEVTRRTLIDLLLLDQRPFHGKMDLLTFLKRIWALSSMPSTDRRFKDAEGDIWKHMVMNEDWDYSYLLYTRLDLAGCSDEVFLTFLETCVHPLVGDDEDNANRVRDFNRMLRPDGFRLSHTRNVSGRPVYTAVRLGEGSRAAIYEVVLSFAGEDREYVQAVADFLSANDVELFYDRYEEVTLWGKDLV